MKIAFTAGKVIGDSLFYSDNNCNALMKYDLYSDTVVFLRCFPNDNNVSFLHKECLQYNGKLIFTPNMSECISIYNPDNNDIECIHLRRYNDSRFCFSGGFIKGRLLYIIPGNMSQSLIRCDVETFETEELFSFGKKLNLDQTNEETFWKTCLYKNLIVFPKLGTNSIYTYDISTGEVRVINSKIEKLDSAYCYDGTVWISTSDGRLYTWNPDDDCVEEKQINSNNKSCAYIVSWNGRPYLIPNYGKEILIYDNNQFHNDRELVINNCELDVRGIHFESFDIWRNNIILYPRNGGNIVVIDMKKIYEKNATIKFDDSYKRNYLCVLQEKAQNGPIKENNPYSLRDFIDGLNV